MNKDPAPLVTGPTKWRAENCVTHHHACDCREWEHANRIEELERDSDRYRFLRDVWGRQISRGESGDEFGVSTPSWRGEWETFDEAIDAAMNGANA